jgi:hypothetical protein
MENTNTNLNLFEDDPIKLHNGNHRCWYVKPFECIHSYIMFLERSSGAHGRNDVKQDSMSNGHLANNRDGLPFHSTLGTSSPHSPGTAWNFDFADLRASSPPLLEDPWALPSPQMPPSSYNYNPPLSPMYATTFSGYSFRYVQDSLVRPLTDEMASLAPQPPKTCRELPTHHSALAHESVPDLENNPRDHPLYDGITPKANRFYHYPFKDADLKATHTYKPEKLKCNYEYFPSPPFEVARNNSRTGNLSTPTFSPTAVKLPAAQCYRFPRHSAPCAMNPKHMVGIDTAISHTCARMRDAKGV